MEDLIATTVSEWLSGNVSAEAYKDDIIAVFKKAVQHVVFPERSWFGHTPSKSAVSILHGSIYLVGVFDDKIEILVDEDLGNQIGHEMRRVAAAERNHLDLYWISAPIKAIRALVENDMIWDRFQHATLKVAQSTVVSAEKEAYLKGKIRLSSFSKDSQHYIDGEFIIDHLQKHVELSLATSREVRLERLEAAPKMPQSTKVWTRQFIRNADVIAEVLFRAGGKCEGCKTAAPFKRAKTGEGYLEVHHILPLAKGGEDTVANAVALCPNCHRERHYGEGSPF